jgi:hypothetical protein
MDNPEGGWRDLKFFNLALNNLDSNPVFAFAGFDRSGKCTSHFGGLVGARIATEYSQILFLSSGGSLNSKHSLHNPFVLV